MDWMNNKLIIKLCFVWKVGLAQVESFVTHGWSLMSDGLMTNVVMCDHSLMTHGWSLMSDGLMTHDD